MKFSTAREFTLKRLFFGDMLLNWFLGIVLIAFPGVADGLLGREPLLPLLVYRVIGAGFLVFAGWQTWHVVKEKLGPGALLFAAALALGPVILLTAALVFMNFDLRPVARAALWFGDGYMLLLTAWYAYLARWQKQEM